MNVIKTMTFTSFGGLLLAGVVVFAISEYDGYYDWLMIKQSLLTGLGIGLIVGLGIVDYQSENSRLKSIISTSTTSLKRWFSLPSESTVLPQTESKKTISIGQMIWRGGLVGILGLLIGAAGGLWFCAEQYSGLSNSQQDWIIFYVPYYAVILLFSAGLGLALGTVAGIVWGYFTS
jgi:hypothetical protein